MRQRTAIVVTLSLALIGAWAAGLYAQNRERRSREPSPPPPRSTPAKAVPIPDEPGQPTRLQIDVFELTCTGDQLAALDLDKIVADDAPPTRATPWNRLHGARFLAVPPLRRRARPGVLLQSADGPPLNEGKAEKANIR